jgi:diguanylate cyclase (GGDEF)-like protein
VNWTRPILLTLLVLFTSLGVTWAVWDHERQAARHEVLTQFDYSLGDAVSRVEQRMGTYELLLRGVQSLFNTTGAMDRQRFRDYVNTLDLDANFSGIQTIGVVQWVPGAQADAHIEAMRKQGAAGYAILPPGSRADYAPIVQREPYIGLNRAVLGFDSWAEPVRRRALERARDSGMATLSGKVRLSVDTVTARPGFIMYLPIYASGQPIDSVAQRRAHLLGWIYASFRMHDVIASLYGEEPPGLTLAIYDGIEPSETTLLHRIGDTSASRRPAVISANEYLVVGGHDWTLTMSANDDFKARFGRNAEWLIATAGSGLSLLLALLTWLMMTGRGRAMRLASTMTKELCESEEKFRAIAESSEIAEQRIRQLAFFDALTRLPNRTLLLDRLMQAITASARSEACGAVLFIDLDHFKTLNDTLGHDKGDLLLQQVAQRLAASVLESDTVARVGSDEFVVVLGSLSENHHEAARQTEVLGEKLLEVIGMPYQLAGLEYHITASIGAAVFSGHQASTDELLKQADLAMYKSKERGRNTVCFFDPDMQTAVVARAALEAGLRHAIDSSQLLLHYQPQVDGDRTTGVEALVRWQHPQRGIVPPADFIPLAEETGLIVALGGWVLEAACVQLAQWAIRPEMAHLTIAVNVSIQQFRAADFVEKVLAVLSRTGARADRLKLELTESVLVDNVQDIIQKMCALKTRGVVFSLDDFGTGYSSLSYLKVLPLNQLKIDRSFVRDVLVDPNDAAIARTIVALAQSLGLGVIAEGVETAAQRDFLAAQGCHAYQGYYFCRPLPIEGFEAFFRQTEALRCVTAVQQ